MTNEATGDDAPARQEGTATATSVSDSTAESDNDSQQTLACRNCDSTNIRRVQGDTGVGRRPTDDGPYACNDCGWHGEPVERPKQTGGKGRRGFAGQLANADPDDLRADGGSKYVVETGDGYVGTYAVKSSSGTCEVNAVTIGYDRGDDLALVADGDRAVRITTDATTADALRVGVVNGDGFLSIGQAAKHHLGVAAGGDIRLYETDGKHVLVNADDDPFVATDGGVITPGCYERHAIASALYGPVLGGGE